MFRTDVLNNIVRLVKANHHVNHHDHSKNTAAIIDCLDAGCSKAIRDIRLIMGRTIQQVVRMVRLLDISVDYYIECFKQIQLESIKAEISEKIVECADKADAKRIKYNDIWDVPKGHLERMMKTLEEQVTNALESLEKIHNGIEHKIRNFLVKQTSIIFVDKLTEIFHM